MQNQGRLYRANFALNKEDEKPLNEYPRPNLVRKNWINLNGVWDFAISKENKIPSVFSKTIRIPYAVESLLSGINKLVEPNDYLIYQKKINLPKTMEGKQILLHFEGIDQTADIYLDNKLIKSHSGIASFTVSFDYKPTFVITVIANDKTDLVYYARGKQTLNPRTCFYTTSSGIIKSVWLEAVNPTYIKNIYFYPNYDKKTVGVFVKTNTTDLIKISIDKNNYEIKPNEICTINLPHFHPWSHLDPYLYQVTISIKTDTVSSYFGVRKISTKVINGHPRILLNDKPIFINGVLNQGYYFLGDLTPRHYQDYIDDITRMKELGFNTLRIHAKTEDNRFYYYCDKLGMLLIQDFVNGGGLYQKSMTEAPRLHRHWDYRKLNLNDTGRSDKSSQKIFYDEVDFYLDHFSNYPSIIIYTIFNEAWGEFKPNELYQYCKNKDQQHLFDTASGWIDADSNFYSIHTYKHPKFTRKDRRKRPVIYTEVGGIGYKINGHSYFDGYFVYKTCKDQKQYHKRLTYLYENALHHQIKKNHINAIIYTQLTDCEIEYNGLYTFDRAVLKVDKNLIIKLNKHTYETFNKSLK